MLTQRLGSSTQLDAAFISDFIRIVKDNPGSCDEVWLATSYGFPPLSVHRDMADKLAVIADRLREAQKLVAFCREQLLSVDQEIKKIIGEDSAE